MNLDGLWNFNISTCCEYCYGVRDAFNDDIIADTSPLSSSLRDDTVDKPFQTCHGIRLPIIDPFPAKNVDKCDDPTVSDYAWLLHGHQ